MLEIIILSMIIIGLCFAIFIKFQMEYSKNRTDTSRYLSIIFTCFGLEMACSYGNLLVSIFTGIINPPWYRYVFVLTFALIMLSVAAEISLILKFYEYSDHKVKYSFLHRLFYFFLVIILSIYAGFTFYRVDFIENGFSLHQINLMLLILLAVIYIPISVIILILYRKSIKGIRNKSLIYPMHVAIFLTSFSTFDRFSYFGFYNIIPDYNIFVLINIICVFILVFTLIFMFIYPDFAESLGIYFSVKSIYLITKSGRTIFSHNFKNNSDNNNLINSDEFMIGGFISAMSSGLEKAIKLKGKINKLSIGNIKLLFNDGENIIGVLIVNEANERLLHTLMDFVNQFEKLYDNESSDDNLGSFISNNRDKIESVIENLFGFK
ncbi:MAG: hypothetical protein GF329_22495 [Candidatus Lokiarchaeota archaeon]|nr:hypothetical protein [Candidatus Lokiarchaeota archaeon]